MLAASKSTLVEKHFFFSHHQVKVRNKKLGANVLFNNVRMSSFHCSTYFFLTIICSLGCSEIAIANMEGSVSQ